MPNKILKYIGGIDMKRGRRYYKVGERVWIIPERTLGVVKELRISPQNNIYKAVVEITKKINDATMITTKEFNLWEIDKNKIAYYRRLRRKRKRNKVLVIPVKYFDNDVEELQEIPVGDWIDLRSRVDIEIKHMESAKIPLNVAMKLPEGYEAHIAPRSSTYDKWGIIMANSLGIIDNSYCGNDDEWMFNAIALKGDTKINKGDRICQFKIVPKMKKERFKFKKVDKLLDPNRGGFGSTGTN
jgi:dUTP pyrophosphatase